MTLTYKETASQKSSISSSAPVQFSLFYNKLLSTENVKSNKFVLISQGYIRAELLTKWMVIPPNVNQ